MLGIWFANIFIIYHTGIWRNGAFDLICCSVSDQPKITILPFLSPAYIALVLIAEPSLIEAVFTIILRFIRHPGLKFIWAHLPSELLYTEDIKSRDHHRALHIYTPGEITSDLLILSWDTSALSQSQKLLDKRLEPPFHSASGLLLFSYLCF